MDEKIGGRPRKGPSVRVNVTRKLSPELIEAMEGVTNNQSELLEAWMWVNPHLRGKRPAREYPQCSQCNNEAEIECKIGNCAPSTWFCGKCYIEKHIPDEEERQVK